MVVPDSYRLETW